MPGETCWAGGMQSPAAARLHVLLSMMNVCIKWDKSADNAVSLHWLVVSDNDHRLLMSLAGGGDCWCCYGLRVVLS